MKLLVVFLDVLVNLGVWFYLSCDVVLDDRDEEIIAEMEPIRFTCLNLVVTNEARTVCELLDLIDRKSLYDNLRDVLEVCARLNKEGFFELFDMVNLISRIIHGHGLPR